MLAGAVWTPDAVASLRQGGTSFALALQQKGAFVALSMGGRPTNQPKPLAAMSKPTFKDRVLKALGMADDAAEDAIADAVEQLASKEDETKTETVTPTPTPEAPPATPSVPQAKAEAGSDLASENERLKDRVAELEADEHEREIQAAVASFKIASADVKGWKEDFKANAAAARRALARIPEGTVKPSATVGAPQTGDPVVLTRAQARDPKQYRTARAEAKKRGVTLEIID
jgi:hypothetical protein